MCMASIPVPEMIQQLVDLGNLKPVDFSKHRIQEILRCDLGEHYSRLLEPGTRCWCRDALYPYIVEDSDIGGKPYIGVVSTRRRAESDIIGYIVQPIISYNHGLRSGDRAGLDLPVGVVLIRCIHIGNIRGLTLNLTDYIKIEQEYLDKIQKVGGEDMLDLLDI